MQCPSCLPWSPPWEGRTPLHPVEIYADLFSKTNRSSRNQQFRLLALITTALYKSVSIVKFFERHKVC